MKITKKLLLVDADGLVYHSSRETLEESIQVINDKIQNMYDKTEATHSAFFISQGRYFRHGISADYKQSRGKYQTQLKWLKTLKSYLIEQYNAQSMQNVEADDLVAYWYYKKLYWAKFTNPHSNSIWMLSDKKEDADEVEDVSVILSSPDKDLLQSIEGNHFNYSYKLVDKDNPESVEKGWWVDTSKDKAEQFRWIQMLMGDNTDGIRGVPGTGIKGAEKIIEAIYSSNTPQYYPEEILSRYISHYHSVSKGIYEFQKNYRLLHLLNTDEDYLQEVGELPKLLIANTIKKPEILEYT